jgi:2',3'-cyclic-nucleotide 2'-phosphodiesterase (5'-nucleotidase family)
MTISLKGTGLAIFLLSATACTSHYTLTDVSRQRVVIDKRYDSNPDKSTTLFLAPYKQKVDAVMSPVLGHVARDMVANRPESDLSNLLADILMWAAKDYNEKPVLAVYNMGGIRAALTKGPVTYGDVVAVAPFENKIAFTTLKGTDLLELFKQIAHRGGEGVSRGVQLVISEKGDLLSARLNGQEIDPQASYRVTTIDYLVQGNDGMPAFKNGTDLVAPQEDSNNSRFIIMNYFKAKEAKGETVDSQVEGRIVLQK